MVRGPDLQFPAMGRSLLPVLCGPVPIAIILITEREQDVLPSLCFQAAYVPIPIIVVSGDHMVPIGDLPDPILAVVPVPGFHALAIKDPACPPHQVILISCFCPCGVGHLCDLPGLVVLIGDQTFSTGTFLF